VERLAYRTCPLCEATCGLEIEIVDDQVKRIRGDRRHVLSAGFICPKGSTLKQLHEDPDRLRSPLIKDGDLFREAGWDEAFTLIADRLGEIHERYGRQAVALYLGNPNAHQFENTLALRPFARALGTRNIYSASTVDQMPKHVSSGLMFGHPGNIPVPDLDRTRFLLMLGANPYESNGSLCTAPDFPGRLEALQARGGTLVVVDPRRTKTAAVADRWIPIRPGTDPAFLLAVAQVLFAEGLTDLEDLAGFVNGYDQAAAAVEAFSPERVAGFTGIDPETVRWVARRLAASRPAVVYGRIGTHTVPFGTLGSWAVDLLNVVTGNLDRPGGAMFPLPSHTSARRRPRPFATGRWASRVREMPEVLGELPAATLADEILTPGEGQVRALFTVAGNPVLTIPDSARLDSALARLDFMVSVDCYLNETTRHADVILPPPSALERSHYDLNFTSLSIRNYACYSPPVFPTTAPTEFEILVKLTAIAAGLGAGADPVALAEASLMAAAEQAVADPDSPVHGRDPTELVAALDGPLGERFLDLMLRTGCRGDGFGLAEDGLTLDLLRRHPHGIDLGPLLRRLADVLATVSGQIELLPEPIAGDLPRLQQAIAAAPSGGNGQLLLIGRRHLRSNNSWLHNVEVLVKGKDRCTLQIHPADAGRLGLEEGMTALVASATGKVTIAVEITDDISPGVVSIPYGWGHDLPGSQLQVASARPGVNTNLLTDAGMIDPLSGNAVLNGIPVTVEPA
jgi:anaerobic selenocysteine-containing dehydrogenase